MKVAIDPGHGGRDPGGVGFIREVDIVYPWAEELKKNLERVFDVQFTHERPTSKRKKVTLGARVRAAKKMEADLYISVHADAFNKQSATGASVYVYSTSSGAYGIAKQILPELQKGVGSHGNLPKTANFYVLRKTSMPAMLLEIGFVTNPDDGLWLMKNYKLQATRVANKLIEILKKES